MFFGYIPCHPGDTPFTMHPQRVLPKLSAKLLSFVNLLDLKIKRPGRSLGQEKRKICIIKSLAHSIWTNNGTLLYFEMLCTTIRSLQHSHSAISNILSVPSFIFGVFPIRYIEHLNEIFKWIILFISDNRILITALKKLCSEFCSFFFQHCPGNNVLS